MRLILLATLLVTFPLMASADVSCLSSSATNVRVQISQGYLTFIGLDRLGIPSGSLCQNSGGGTWSLRPLRISSYCHLGQIPLAVSARAGQLAVTKDGFPVFLGMCE